MRRFAKRILSMNPARLWLGLLTAWFFVVISGLPLPMLQDVIRESDIASSASSSGANGKIRRAEKDRSQPFPCMFSSCGCSNAEQCWRQCCCHDLSSKLAWAKQNHVVPPDFVIAEARQKGLLSADESLAVFSKTGNRSDQEVAASVAQCDKTKPTCPHCAAKNAPTKSCCAIKTTGEIAKRSCCEVHDEVGQHECDAKSGNEHHCCSTDSTSTTSSEPQVDESAPRSRSLIVLQSMRCRGDALNLLGFAPMLPVQHAEAPRVEARLIGRIAVVSEQVSGHSEAPLGPPPWA